MASSASGSGEPGPERTTNVRTGVARTLFGIIDKSMDFLGNRIDGFLSGNSEAESLQNYVQRENTQRVNFRAEVQTPTTVGTVQLGRPRHNSTGITYQTPRPDQIRAFEDSGGDDCSSESDADHCTRQILTIAAYEKKLKATVQNAQHRELQWKGNYSKASLIRNSRTIMSRPT